MGADFAFWFVLVLAFVAELSSALNGHFSASTAQLAHVDTVEAMNARVQLRVVLEELKASSFAPQVLYPIVAREDPEWIFHRTTTPSARQVVSPATRKARIAIVIDDLGPDLAHTDRALLLPAAITLSFLPFADATPWLAQEARHRGHEILVHMPMQANGLKSAGPMELRSDLSTAEMRRRLDTAIARVSGAIGINNHMGSAFTSDPNALRPVCEEMAARHLLFLDSRTTADTQVAGVARAMGVSTAERDVFLDDELTPEAIGLQFRRLEERARQQGVAIAIGHPHDVTLAALLEWTAHARSRGFELIRLSDAVSLKMRRETELSLATPRR